MLYQAFGHVDENFFWFEAVKIVQDGPGCCWMVVCLGELVESGSLCEYVSKLTLKQEKEEGMRRE